MAGPYKCETCQDTGKITADGNDMPWREVDRRRGLSNAFRRWAEHMSSKPCHSCSGESGTAPAPAPEKPKQKRKYTKRSQFWKDKV